VRVTVCKGKPCSVVKLDHANRVTAKPGKEIKLAGTAKDPDENAVNFLWWQYEEVDTYTGKISFSEPGSVKLLSPSQRTQRKVIPFTLF